MSILAVNKQALFDYAVLETYEAGLVLAGQEVKSARGGHISLKGAFATIKKGEFYLTNAHISPYKMAGNLHGYEPTQARKLLLNKREIKHLIGKTQEKGLTIVPLKVYTKHNRIKVEIAVVKGKKLFDKRELIKKREDNRKIGQLMRGKLR